MNVDIDVENALVILQQLQDGQDNVVDVTEAGGLGFLGVMQAAGPVDGNVSRLLVQLDGRRNRPSGRQLAKLVETVKDWTILADVEPLHLFVVLAHVVGPNGSKETDVIVRMELCHLFLGRFVRSVDLHLSVESIVEQKVVGHAYTVRLHGVTLPIVVVAYVTCQEIVVLSEGRYKPNNALICPQISICITALP